MRTNGELQRDVEAALGWEPSLRVAEIGVIVKDGIVTLTGTVDSFAKKAQAEEATKDVVGVMAIVEKIDVQFGSKGRREDNEIARDVLEALRLTSEIPVEKIQVKVEDGWVSLLGELPWNYQKEAAKKAAHHVLGVKGLSNDIIVKSTGNDRLEKKSVEDALTRNGSIDNEAMMVSVSGNKVTLSGTAYSLSQKDDAGRLAWNAPGVWEVENLLKIYHPEKDFSLTR